MQQVELVGQQRRETRPLSCGLLQHPGQAHLPLLQLVREGKVGVLQIIVRTVDEVILVVRGPANRRAAATRFNPLPSVGAIGDVHLIV